MRRLSIIGIAVTLALVAAGSLLAHGVLLSSSPAANSNVAIVPSEVRLVFSERPEREFTSIALIAPGGGSVALDNVVIGPGNAASVRVLGPLVPGLYRVSWRTVARDGHPLDGEFTFSIAPDAVGAARADTAPPAPAAHGIPAPGLAKQATDFAPIATLLRWLTLASVIAAVGAVVFRMIIVARLAREMPDDVADAYLPSLVRGAAGLGLLAVAVALASAALRLAIQALALGATGPDGAGVFRLLVATTWGRAWLVHVSGAALALGALAAVRGGRRHAWTLAALGAVLLTTGLALSGHAVAAPRYAAAAVAGHVVHAVAAAGWLGSLLVIAAVALPLSFRLQRDDRWTVVADIVRVFSPAALVFAGTTVAAGVLIAWLQVPSLGALLGSEYGRVLLVKLAFVGVTAAIGAYNWRRVRPTLGELPGARRLRRSATSELAVAALVLAVTAVLVATPMPLP